MKTKTKLVITLGTIATGAIAYLVTGTTEESIKDTVIKVWDDIKDSIVNDLDLEQVPTLAWDGSDGSVMHVKMTYYYNQRGFSMDRVVTKTETDYVIHVNIEALTHTIKYLKQGAFYLNGDITKLAITQFFYHECRHLWQNQGNFHVGERKPLFELNFGKGHGESREELDANEYACSMAKTKREKALAEFLKKEQECSGKLFGANNEKEKKAYVKEFNPILKLFM